MKTIESPGVQINEIDLSLRATTPVGTNVLVTGFAQKGPSDEIIQVTTLSEFEQIYGIPQTPAERYFYHTARPLFNTAGKIFTYRLPYGGNSGNGFGAAYGALVYPASAVSIRSDNFGTALSTYTQQQSGALYVIGRPTHFELSRDQYNDILQQKTFSWSNNFTSTFASSADLGKAAIIILNKSQTTIDNLYQGYYVGVIDNSNLSPATNFDGILDVRSVSQSANQTTNYTTIPETRLGFALSAISDANTITFGQNNDSISEVMENLSKFDVSTSDYDDTLSLGMFKLRQSVFAPDTITLDYILSEQYVASLDYYRQINSQTGGAPLSFFLETSEDQSPNITLLVNENLSHKNGSTWLGLDGKPTNKVRMTSRKFVDDTYFSTVSSRFGITTNQQLSTMRYALTAISNNLGNADSLFAAGSFLDSNPKTAELGTIPSKIDRLLDVVSNVELFNFDLVVDGGISTINAVSQYLSATTGVKYFDDTVNVSAISGLYVTDPSNVTGAGLTFRDDWKTIFDRFANFAQFARQDCFFVADAPRHVFVQGANFKVLEDSNANFSQNMFNPLRNIVSVCNTSYATVYANWVKVYDTALDDQTWVPFSGTAASNMVNTDTNFQPWFAPAGFTRGLVTGVNDIAIYPTQKQRDQLYRVSINPVAFFPNDGFVIYGQKTLQKKPSAFDRINVRRLFLNLEKAVRDTVKYFVFEPNTLLTRTRVINTLTPIFENAKNTEGVYDYLIVCDERNNPPAVIDNNELVVDIYLKPVRAAEFILVNFYATRTDTNFQELVG
jgi:phage tail sheath protein FI